LWLLLLFPTSAFAQDFGAMDWGSVYINAGMYGAAMDSATQSSRNRPPQDRVVPNTKRTGPSTQQLSPNVTKFNPTLARRRANLANFITVTRRSNPETAAAIQTLTASTDIFAAMEQAIVPYGLSTNDVADAFVVYWISAWEASRGIVNGTESRQRAQAVKLQVIEAFTSNAQFGAATEAQKQEFAEALLLQAALLSGYLEAASGNPEQMQLVETAVKRDAKLIGLDLEKMNLTTNGFVFQ
jgi:hypothetical protein